MSDELDDHEGVGSLLGAPADPGGWAQVPAADEPLPTTEEDAVARERGDRGLSDGDIARSSVVMAAGTLASRVLGVARNTLTAAVVGATGVLAADAWNVANTLPNIIHLLLAGGILNAVIVPQIARAMKAEDGGTAYVNRLLTLGLTILAGATVVLTAASPLLVALYVDPGWPSGATALATTFAFICVPQVFFYGMYTLLGQVLNAAGRFGAFMWAPALANVVALAGLAWFYLTDQPFQAPVDQWSPTMIAVLGGTATLSIVLQALVLVPSLRRAGFAFRPSWGIRGSGLRGASRMAMWTFLALVVAQGGFTVTTRVLTAATERATRTGLPDTAGLAGYSFVFLIFMLPHSLVTVSLVTALFTRMSTAAADEDTESVRADLRAGIRTPALLLVPVTAASIVLAPLITQAVFPLNPRNETDALVGVFVAMIAGLVPYGWLYLVQRVFYALEDGRTPFALQLLVTGLSIAFTVYGSTRPVGEVATWVGIGQSVGNLAAALVGFTLLRRALGPLGLRPVLGDLLRLVVAAALAGVIGWAFATTLTMLVGDTLLPGTLVGGGVGIAMLLLTWAVALLLGVTDAWSAVAPVGRVLGAVGRRLPRRRG